MTKLLHDITQLGYVVSFNSDFKNMIRVDLTEDYPSHYDEPFYEHSHLSYPDGTLNQLEKAVEKCLKNFLDIAQDRTANRSLKQPRR